MKGIKIAAALFMDKIGSLFGKKEEPVSPVSETIVENTVHVHVPVVTTPAPVEVVEEKVAEVVEKPKRKKATKKATKKKG